MSLMCAVTFYGLTMGPWSYSPKGSRRVRTKNSWKTWKNCAQKLDRKYSHSVRRRYKLLISNGAKGSKKWQLSEDKQLLKIILKVSFSKRYFSTAQVMHRVVFTLISPQLTIMIFPLALIG